VLVITWLVVIVNNHELPVPEGIVMTASYYGSELQGHKMANGERFNPREMIVAHKRLPLETKLLIVNPDNNKRVIATIKDRGPYVAGRNLDVSTGVKKKLDLEMGKRGTALVKVYVLE